MRDVRHGWNEQYENAFEAALNSCIDVPASEAEAPQDLKTVTLYPSLVTEEFRNAIIRRYPSMFEKQSLINMLEYLLFSAFINHDTKRLLIPVSVLAEIENKTRFIKQKAYRGLPFLYEVQKHLPEFQWTESTIGHPREVINRGFDAEVERLIEQNTLFKRSRGVTKVFFRTGEVATKAKQYALRAKLDEKQKNDVSKMILLPQQKLIIDYLEAVDTQTYTRLINKNIDNVLKEKEKIKYPQGKSKGIQERILGHVQEFPKPHFKATDTAKTVRIYATSDSFMGMKRELRKAMMAGCYEADLKSSQFAIAASVYRSKKAREFIKTGKSIWNELYYFSKGHTNYTEEEKKIIKNALYAIIFGTPEYPGIDLDGEHNQGIRSRLSKYGFSNIMDHEIMQDLISQRDKWFKEIKAKGGWNDAYSQFQSLSETRNIKSVASSLLQSIELDIMAPLFQLAIDEGDKKDFKIISFLHDSITYIVNDKRKLDTIQNLMQETVKKSADKHKVITYLEFTKLGE
jgi:hypothetical protein